MSGYRTSLGSAIYTTLTTAPGTAVWGDRVYNVLASMSTPHPLVIFQHIEGGDRNDNPVRIIDTEYRIECVAGTLSQARAGADYLDAALHNQTVAMTGWNLIAITKTDDFERVEETEGRQYWRLGGFYRFRYSEA